MMQVYTDAIHESKSGSPQYVLKKSLDICRTNDQEKVAEFLREGYRIDAKCVNGDLEQRWTLHSNSESDREIRALAALSKILGLRKQRELIVISTQEFYDWRFEPEFVRLSISLWDCIPGKPDTIQITPLDRIADPEAFLKGQETARKILDVLYHCPANIPFP